MAAVCKLARPLQPHQLGNARVRADRMTRDLVVGIFTHLPAQPARTVRPTLIHPQDQLRARPGRVHRDDAAAVAGEGHGGNGRRNAGRGSLTDGAADRLPDGVRILLGAT